jgi:hypothetical protein
MLVDFDHGAKVITTVPFQQKYQLYLRKLASNVHPLAITTAKQAFHAELENEVITTSWVPGEIFRSCRL